MFGIIESQIKTDTLVYLAMKGGCAGRQLARRLHKSATPVFKALRSLEKNKIIKKQGPPFFYALNTQHPCYPELVSILHKTYESDRRRYRFLPKIKPERKIDPTAVYEIAALRPKAISTITIQKLSDTLRKLYA